MARRIRKVSPALWLTCSALVWLVAFTSARASAPPSASQATVAQKPAEAPKTSQAPTPQAQGGPPPVDAQGYVGEKACIECHDEQKAGYFQGPHHRASDPRTPAAKHACEECHGPTGKHAEDPVLYDMPRDFTKMKPAEITELCTTCHKRGEHAFWNSSPHEARGLSCVTCHSLHAPKSEESHLIREDQFAVCGQCHRDKVQKQLRSGHMPVREGKLQCMTCHNAHGSPNVRQLRTGTSVNEACTTCHSEKRGPFLWPHAPVVENCATCHDPHGSNNDRMLVAKNPFLCQRCHVTARHPPTIYDGAAVKNNVNRVISRSCVNCHSNIHGSNHPSGLFFAR